MFLTYVVYIHHICLYKCVHPVQVPVMKFVIRKFLFPWYLKLRFKESLLKRIIMIKPNCK